MVQSGTYSAAVSMGDAEGYYQAVLNLTGCDGLTCLLGKPALDVAAAYSNCLGGTPVRPGPVVDGIALSGDPYDLLEAGKYNRRVPVLLGPNREESVAAMGTAGASGWTEAYFDAAFRQTTHLNDTALAIVKQLYANGSYPYPTRVGNQSHWWCAAVAVA